MDIFSDEQLLEEVKKRKLIHPDIVDGWQKVRKIQKLEETIANAQKELAALKNEEVK